MSKALSEREGAMLRVLLANMPHGSTGSDLVHGLREQLGSISPADVTPAGVHRTAGSLCRKNLAWRAGTPKQQNYKITQSGRNVLDGKHPSLRLPGAPESAAPAEAAEPGGVLNKWSAIGSTVLARTIAVACHVSQEAGEFIAAQAADHGPVDFTTRTGIVGGAKGYEAVLRWRAARHPSRDGHYVLYLLERDS